ncbi:MAG: D-alanyl-D-alanine carboxypeptidase/D-alanyl-D-alanine-endopeptidase [Burkholderiales bacterium]|nr:D-alanyl-D-alanine carboxypeptidase/D-alanyl-D-alanine-endopeptidase [Burkholderiales bacterium]
MRRPVALAVALELALALALTAPAGAQPGSAPAPSTAPAPAPAPAEPLPPAVLQALDAAHLPPDALAAVALPLGHDAPAWGWRERVPMAPASTMKLVTSVVALDTLGPDLRGRTALLTAAPLAGGVLRGDLVLQGGGDADLGVPQLWALLLELRQQGVRDIRGDLVLDRTRYRPQRTDLGRAPFDDSPEFPYNVIPDALMPAGDLLPLALQAGRHGVHAATLPPLPGLEIDSRMTLVARPCDDWDSGWRPARVSHHAGRTRIELDGSFPRGCRVRTALQLIDRDELAARLFAALWHQLGGRWRGMDGQGRWLGRVRDGAAPAGARVLAEHEARPWGELLRPMNKQSDNVLARLLYLELGVPAMAAHPQATTAELAAAAVRQWFEAHGIDDAGLVLDNGSGLSRSERITPLQMASLLAAAWAGPHAADLAMSLPVAGVDGTLHRRLQGSPAAGWARLKTGSLRDAAALAGYVRDAQGRPWAVAMMVNHEPIAGAQAVLDALVDSLARGGEPALARAADAPPRPRLQAATARPSGAR